jgi:oxygen-independent coproporphyrinogen-3 oxidase
MDQQLIFHADSIRRYDRPGPRYTSYPTAVEFDGEFGQAQYRDVALSSNVDPIPRPLSLYIHIPFCDTVCFYCACSKIVTKDRSRATPYLEHVYRELALQGELFDRDRPVDQLHWGGGTPTFLSMVQMRGLMRASGENFALRDDDGGEYSIEIDPREADVQTVAGLREIGFNRMSLGVQDFDPEVQKAVNRIQTEEQTLAVMDAARSGGFKSINIDLIYGLPHQSVVSFGRTLDRIIAAAPDRLSIFNYAHLPQRFKPQRRIRHEDLPSAAEKLDILQSTVDKLTGAGYVYIGMDHFALPQDELAVAQREGTLYRNFQGYSTHSNCDLIGIGITSIGKVGDTYSQNTKSLESYYASLEGGRLPIERGVRLDEDDRLRREVITRLICDFELDIGRIESRYGISFRDYFAAEQVDLETLESDGLIRLDDLRIQVQPAGRLLVRNICMTFDRYRREKSVGNLFSRMI